MRAGEFVDWWDDGVTFRCRVIEPASWEGYWVVEIVEARERRGGYRYYKVGHWRIGRTCYLDVGMSTVARLSVVDLLGSVIS